MLLQYQPNTCHLSIRFLGKSIQRLRGNALLWQWLVLDWPPNRKVIWRQASFPTKHRVERTCEPYWGSNCEIYTHHCQGFEPHKSLGGKGATFGTGITAPFVASLPGARSRAPTALCRGGCDCLVVAALSIPQGVCSCLMGASSYRFSHGRWKADQKHGMKKVIVRWNSWRE